VGLTFQGIKQTSSLAQSVGISITAYKVAAFAIGGFFAGLMGGAYVQYVSAVDPTVFGFLPTIYILIYVIVGGEGSFIGPAIGAALLTVLPEVARPLKSWMPVLFAVILMLVIFLMPEGLVGLPRRIGKAFRRRPKAESDAAG
jgi:branched-chain amino acid transport system permease protein